MKKRNKFTPYDVYESIYKIDYLKLQEEDKKVIVFDLDNTIMPYHIKKPTVKVAQFMQSLIDMGFNVIIMSNNHKKRISRISTFLGVDYIYGAKKPLKSGYQKVFKKFHHMKKKNYVCVGDQIITDVFGASRVGVDCILVKPILLENEHWYTKLNRITERLIINHFKKINPSMYAKIRNIRGDLRG